jgi:hypothetical protein
MWSGIRRSTLLALILGGLGCQTNKSAVSTKQPPDPLLISKKPVEGRPTSYEPTAVAREAQPISTQPVRLVEGTGVSLGKPRWLPDDR